MQYIFFNNVFLTLKDIGYTGTYKKSSVNYLISIESLLFDILHYVRNK